MATDEPREESEGLTSPDFCQIVPTVDLTLGSPSAEVRKQVEDVELKEVPNGELTFKSRYLRSHLSTHVHTRGS